MAPGADSILKLIFFVLFVLVIVFVGGVFNMVVWPVMDGVIDGGLMSSLGWGSPQDVALLFGALALLALGLVITFWWILSPIRDDVRQERGPGGF